jgi:hypothetical protein
MNKSVALILGVVVFLAGAALARAFLAPSPEPSPAPRRAAASPPAAPGEPSPDFSAELARIRADLAELKTSIAPLQETDLKLRPLLAGALGEAAPARATTSVRADGPAGVGDLLGLDSGRQAAFTRTFEDTMRKIRALEERHASVKKDGKITAITVAAFPDEGKALSREWSQQLDSLLTPEEREKYRKYSMEHSLFPMGLSKFGAEERTITITRTGNQYNLSESVSTGQGGGWTRSASGDESIVAPYRHLLNKAGDR